MVPSVATGFTLAKPGGGAARAAFTATMVLLSRYTAPCACTVSRASIVTTRPLRTVFCATLRPTPSRSVDANDLGVRKHVVPGASLPVERGPQDPDDRGQTDAESDHAED